MKAAIYNPYLDTLGGGERYTLTFAKVLAEIGYDVDIEWKEKSILDKLSKRFGLKFPSNLKIVDSVNRGENYNLIFWVSDGSIPTLRAIKNYIHFQFPFHDVNGSSLLNKMKLFRVNKIICNSKFTKNVIDKEYKVDSTVLYPPVGTDIYKPKRKINQLCYVARFSNLTQNKGHDVLIKQFKKLVKEKKFQDWKLVLAGGVEVGSDVNLKNLKKLASGANIEFVESPSLEVLKDIFGKSKIFWSGAGFGEDEVKSPERVEHFGITLVEAMSAGCVPIVYGGGGYKEVVDNGRNGFLWQSEKELINLTKFVVQKTGEMRNISTNAIETSSKFGYDNFKKNITEILK
jgi:glycosyltransferase involved in cell wall biosynthesis